MADLHLGGLIDPRTHERTATDLKLESADLTKWAAAAAAVTTLPVTLERTDVKITQIALARAPARSRSQE